MMIKKRSLFPIVLISMIVLYGSTSEVTGEKKMRREILIDLYQGEPVTFNSLLEDLLRVRIVYIGEVHRIHRHHYTQKKIVEGLCRKGKKVILALEQMESSFQKYLDRYNDGAISFDELAGLTKWEFMWPNYKDYRKIIETVRSCGGLVVAINADEELIRKIARNGIGGLSRAGRKQFPDTIDLSNVRYKRLLEKILKVHAFMKTDRLQFFYEAQVARDEKMASRISFYLKKKDTKDRVVITLAGSMHLAFSLGIPVRVRRRIKGIKERIVLISESGDLELSPHEKRLAKDIRITHEDLRFLKIPIADYLFVTELKK